MQTESKSNRTITGRFDKETHPVKLYIRFERNFSGTVIIQGHVLDGDPYFTGSYGEITVEKGSTVKVVIQRGSIANDFGEVLPNASINNVIARSRDHYDVVGDTTGKWDIEFVANSDTNVTISCYSGTGN